MTKRISIELSEPTRKALEARTIEFSKLVGRRLSLDQSLFILLYFRTRNKAVPIDRVLAIHKRLKNAKKSV